MPIRFVDKDSNLNVEVNRRPIRPENIIQRPDIVWRTKKEGKLVKTVYQPKMVIGTNEKDSSSIIAYAKLVCPKCDGDTHLRCPDCNGLGKIVMVSKLNEVAEDSSTVLVEKTEQNCPICNGSGRLDSPCDLCKGIGRIGYFTNYEKMDIDESGKEVATDDKQSYEVKGDGSLSEFPQYVASDEMIVRMKIPKSKLHEFYCESWDELEATQKTVKKEKVHDSYTESELYRYAEELVAKNLMVVGTNFVKAKGFQEWHFIAYPTIRDDATFGWLVGYFQAKIEQTHLRPVPRTTQVADEQKVPAKSYLQDLTALVK